MPLKNKPDPQAIKQAVKEKQKLIDKNQTVEK
jgi:hypothetical protein